MSQSWSDPRTEILVNGSRPNVPCCLVPVQFNVRSCCCWQQHEQDFSLIASTCRSKIYQPGGKSSPPTNPTHTPTPHLPSLLDEATSAVTREELMAHECNRQIEQDAEKDAIQRCYGFMEVT